MSDAVKQGPALEQTVHEVQGHYPTDAAMQDGMSRLKLAGYDRADLSLPFEHGGEPSGTPNEAAENPVDEIDKAQVRTMGTSMAAYAGAAAATGITLATGGAAGLAIAAAAAIGLGSGVAASAASQAADQANVDRRNDLGAHGRLVLAVRTTSDEEVAEVTSLMQQTGALDIRRVSRGAEMLTAGHSSASWTGA